MEQLLSKLLLKHNMRMSKRETPPGDMDLDTSPHMKSQETMHRPDSFSDLPSNAKILDSDISPTTPKDPEKHSQNIDLDDSGGEDGGVPLNPTSFTTTPKPKGRITTDLLPSSPHPGRPGFRRLDMDSDLLSSSPKPAPRIRLTIKTDLPSPTSNQTTPRDYIRSPLTSIPEEPAINEEGNMDIDSNEDLPVLEDINSSDYELPAFPGSFPNSSKPYNAQTHDNNDSSLEHENETQPSTRRPSKLSNEIDFAYFESDHLSDPTSLTEKGDGGGDGDGGAQPASLPDVHISWDTRDRWPPDSLDEKELCERVCEEVALLHGFHKVIIK
jgi:hypothetical protein